MVLDNDITTFKIFSTLSNSYKTYTGDKTTHIKNIEGLLAEIKRRSANSDLARTTALMSYRIFINGTQPTISSACGSIAMWDDRIAQYPDISIFRIRKNMAVSQCNSENPIDVNGQDGYLAWFSKTYGHEWNYAESVIPVNEEKDMINPDMQDEIVTIQTVETPVENKKNPAMPLLIIGLAMMV